MTATATTPKAKTGLVEMIRTLRVSLTGVCPDGCPGLSGIRGTEYLHWLDEKASGSHTVLMGATTYRRFAGFADCGPPT